MTSASRDGWTRRRGSTAAVLAVLAIAVVVAFLTAGMFVTRSVRRTMVGQVQAAERSAAAERATDVGIELTAASSRLTVNANQLVVRAAVNARKGDLLQLALDQANHSPGAIGGRVLDPDGAVIAEAGAPITEAPRDAPAFAAQAGHHDGTVVLTARVLDGRSVIGSVQQQFDLAGLVPQLASKSEYPGAAVAVTDRAGNVMLSTVARPAARITTPGLLDLLRAGAQGSATYRSSVLGARIGAVAPVPGTELMVVVGADASAAHAPAAALVRQVATTLVVLLLTVALLLAIGALVMVGARRRLVRERTDADALAHTDALTGLGNRRALEVAVESQKAATGSSAVLIIDLDHLKVINDTYGHAVGDQAITLAAGAITAAMRPEDRPTRFGGDEFVVILPDTGTTDAERVASRIAGAVAGAARTGLPALSVSVGVAAGPNTDLAAVIRAADVGLYRAKRRRPTARATAVVSR